MGVLMHSLKMRMDNVKLSVLILTLNGMEYNARIDAIILENTGTLKKVNAAYVKMDAYYARIRHYVMIVVHPDGHY
jgi:hypothetical protein